MPILTDEEIEVLLDRKSECWMEVVPPQTYEMVNEMNEKRLERMTDEMKRSAFINAAKVLIDRYNTRDVAVLVATCDIDNLRNCYEQYVLGATCD